jgi:hypothetical protein
MDIYTATSLQPLYRCPRTARTGSTGLVGPIKTATTIAGMLLHRSPSLLRTDNPSSNSSPPLPLLVSTSNKYNSHRTTSRTAQVTHPA